MLRRRGHSSPKPFHAGNPPDHLPFPYPSTGSNIPVVYILSHTWLRDPKPPIVYACQCFPKVLPGDDPAGTAIEVRGEDYVE
jgi:hypothetical protein